MAWESPLQRGSKSYSHKRRNVRFEGLRRVHTPPQPLTAHTAAYTAKQGAFRTGVVSLPSERFARFGNPAWPGVRTANFAAFGSWSGVLPKSAESLRNSDALMRVAVPRCRGPAGLRCSVCNLVMLLFFRSVRRGFTHVRDGGGITTLGALCMLPKCRTAQKAAKFAVLTPGPGMFVNVQHRVEGSDSGPVRKAPVSPCEPLCAIFQACATYCM